MYYSIITARYIGSEYAIVSVLKYDVEDGKIKLLPYYITPNFIAGNCQGCCNWLMPYFGVMQTAWGVSVVV